MRKKKKEKKKGGGVLTRILYIKLSYRISRQKRVGNASGS